MTQLVAKETEILEVMHTFRAMNTGVEITIFTTEPDRAVAAGQQVEELFRANEAALSRFRAQSELTKLNQAGYLENVSDLLYDNIAAARRMHEFTGGIFDPTLLDALEAGLPAMLAAYRTEGEFWMAFAGEADLIEDRAGEHCAMVQERIRGMLARHGRYLIGVDADA